MKKTKFISVLIALFMSVISFGQSTTESFAHTLQFSNNDLLQEFNAVGFLSPSTFSGSPSTISYSSTLPFGNNDNLQIYNALRMLGASPAFTTTGWSITGNSITAGRVLGSTNAIGYNIIGGNNTAMHVDSLGGVTMYTDPTGNVFPLTIKGGTNNAEIMLQGSANCVIDWRNTTTSQTWKAFNNTLSTGIGRDALNFGTSASPTSAYFGISLTGDCFSRLRMRIGSLIAPTAALDITGDAKISSSVTIGNATTNTTSLGIMRVGQGTSWADFGERSAGLFGVWFVQTTPTTSNYGILGTSSVTRINGNAVSLQVATTDILACNSGGAVITGSGSVSGAFTANSVQANNIFANSSLQGNSLIPVTAVDMAISARPSTTNGVVFNTLTNNTLESARINNTGQMGVGTGSIIAASAKLQITSTTQGFLPPVMTATQGSAISSPAEGLMIYVTNTNGTFTAKGWWGYDGAAWLKLNN